MNSRFRWVLRCVLIGAAMIAGLASAGADGRHVLFFQDIGARDATMRPWVIEVGPVERLAFLVIPVPQKTYDKIIKVLDADARLPYDPQAPDGTTFDVEERILPSGRVADADLPKDTPPPNWRMYLEKEDFLPTGRGWVLHPQGMRAIISLVGAAYAARKRGLPELLSCIKADLDASQQSAR